MIPAHLQNRSIDQLRSTQETIRCFLVQTTGEGFESVITTEEGQCVGGFDYHRSEKIIRRFALGDNDTYPTDWTSDKADLALPYCTRCGNHEFSPEAMKKSSGSKGRGWVNADTGERGDNLNDFGPGAMWFLTWYINEETGIYSYTGTDQPPICVRTPGGDWVIDGRASNCTMKDDNVHKCWPRRGTAPNITVDKSFGNTCSAGGGSIITGNGAYHGFLREGYLIKC